MPAASAMRGTSVTKASTGSGPCGARSSASAMARQEPGDLLGQLDHEPVWIEEVEGPVPPRPVHRAGEELDAEAPEPLGFGIDRTRAGSLTGGRTA